MSHSHSLKAELPDKIELSISNNFSGYQKTAISSNLFRYNICILI